MSRQVRHILVKDKVLVDRLYQQIKDGADFGSLAKKYSQDPGSATQGGKFTAHNGQEVQAFDKVAFSIGNNELAPPVRSPEYGWFIIQAQGPVKTSSEVQVAGTIRSQLLQQKKSAALTSWATKVAKSYCTGGEIDYQSGYAPVPDPCAQFAKTTTTTTP
jgi:parvulin-like peptidyl-prolyl isomerase